MTVFLVEVADPKFGEWTIDQAHYYLSAAQKRVSELKDQGITASIDTLALIK